MLNLCQFIGNLGADPEVRTTQSGSKVASLSLAVSERRKQGDSWVDHTEWVKVTVFGKTAEFCENYLSKGRQVYVQGRMSTRKWQDKEGKDRYTTEILANELRALGRKPESDSGGHSGGGGAEPGEDIPF